jgi:NAD(P)-dependent dehydrogenase (short-subunit alcohol dehydrogenase family)
MSKTGLIWGADGGIGQAVSSLLSEKGWNTINVGKKRERMSDLKGTVFEADVSSPFSVQTAVSSISQEADEIDLWMYTVGDIVVSPVDQMSPLQWQKIMDANLTGAFLTTHFSWPLLDNNTHLFYVGAMVERLYLPGMSAYAAAKAGLEAFVEVLRKESRRKVTMVRPSAVNTSFWEKTSFKIPARHQDPRDVAADILKSYQDGAVRIQDLQPVPGQAS